MKKEGESLKQYRVLVVDDDKEIAEAIGVYLTQENILSHLAFDGEEAIKKLGEERYELLIIDIMMPKLDGIRAVSKIRQDSKIPIIFLSAKSEDSDKILGLNMGADDYITKPFNPLELIARVKSLLRRYTDFGTLAKSNSRIRTGALTIDPEAKLCMVDGGEVKLTAIEFKILRLLMQNLGHIFSIDEIYERVWNEPNYNGENTVAVHVRRIREKIEINPKEPKYLKVVWGIGYKIEKYEPVCMD